MAATIVIKSAMKSYLQPCHHLEIERLGLEFASAAEAWLVAVEAGPLSETLAWVLEIEQPHVSHKPADNTLLGC